MLTYLVILLDDTSVSFCGVPHPKRSRNLIPSDKLRKGIVWAMKENLNIQFVYPHYRLPDEHREVIEMIDHTKIGPLSCEEELDVVVLDSPADMERAAPLPCIWQCTLSELSKQLSLVLTFLRKVSRLNIMLTDIAVWGENEFNTYKTVLDQLVDGLAAEVGEGEFALPQLNLLTDRLILSKMNNCGAGDSCVTLAPDGRFYVCPAYYNRENVGSLDNGLLIPNRQLFQLSHAPICRQCDAWQCKRCVWMNGKLTGDVNTPSHQQCVAAHLERNASHRLQQLLIERGFQMGKCSEFRKIDYLDPFNIVNKWRQEKLWGE